MRVGAAADHEPELHGGGDPRHRPGLFNTDLLLQPLAAEIEPILHAPDQAERLHPLQAGFGGGIENSTAQRRSRTGKSLLMSSTTSSRSWTVRSGFQCSWMV